MTEKKNRARRGQTSYRDQLRDQAAARGVKGAYSMTIRQLHAALAATEEPDATD